MQEKEHKWITRPLDSILPSKIKKAEDWTRPVLSQHGAVPKKQQKRQTCRSFYCPPRGRVQWARGRGESTAITINAPAVLSTRPVSAGHGPVVSNGSFYWFVFSAASWARPRVHWTRGVFRLCSLLFVLGGAVEGPGSLLLFLSLYLC